MILLLCCASLVNIVPLSSFSTASCIYYCLHLLYRLPLARELLVFNGSKFQILYYYKVCNHMVLTLHGYTGG